MLLIQEENRIRSTAPTPHQDGQTPCSTILQETQTATRSQEAEAQHSNPASGRHTPIQKIVPRSSGRHADLGTRVMPDHQVGKTTKGAMAEANVRKTSAHRGEEQTRRCRFCRCFGHGLRCAMCMATKVQDCRRPRHPSSWLSITHRCESSRAHLVLQRTSKTQAKNCTCGKSTVFCTGCSPKTAGTCR